MKATGAGSAYEQWRGAAGSIPGTRLLPKIPAMSMKRLQTGPVSSGLEAGREMEGTLHGAENAPRLYRVPVAWQGGEMEMACRYRQGGGQSTLVLLHGLGCSQRSFAGLWRHGGFAHGAVLTLDLPGFGDSDRPEAFSYKLEDHAAACLELLGQLQVGRVHLLGHSMGGAVAVLLAVLLHRQRRLASLIGVESTLIAEDCGVSRVVSGMTRKHFERQFFPEFKTRTPPLHRAYLALELAADHAFYRSADSLWSWARSEKLLGRLLELPVPKLFLYGRRNKNLPVLERLEGVERRAIADSGHFPMNENPSEFYDTLHGFVRS